MWSTISRLLGNKGRNENTNLDRVDKKLNEAVDVFDKKMERNKGFGESPAGGGDPGHLSESYESRQVRNYLLLIYYAFFCSSYCRNFF